MENNTNHIDKKIKMKEFFLTVALYVLMITIFSFIGWQIYQDANDMNIAPSFRDDIRDINTRLV